MTAPLPARRLADATGDEEVLFIAAAAAAGLAPAGRAVAAAAAAGAPAAPPETWTMKVAETPDGHRWAERLRPDLASATAMQATASSAGLRLLVSTVPTSSGAGLLLLLLAPDSGAEAAPGRDALQAAMDDLAALAGLALRALEGSRRLAQAEAEQRAQHQFLSIAAHDLRTPLAAIRGYAQLLLRRPGPGETPQQRTGLQTIVQQTDRLASLTEMVLDVARIQTRRMALRRVTADLGQVVRQVAGAVNGQSGADQSSRRPIRLRLPESGPVLSGDLARLTQITRAMLEFGLRRSGEDKTVEVQLATEDGGALLIVDDTGPSLSAEERVVLFHQLVVGGQDGQSPALGQLSLYIARGAAEAHGGRVWVESPVPQRERGVRLCLWLPAGENSA
jgi:signal transduction histidine kinase